MRQIQNNIPAGSIRSLRRGKWLCVKSSVTKTKDANTMNSAVVAAALVHAIFITRRSPKAMVIMESTAIRWNESMPSHQVFFPMKRVLLAGRSSLACSLFYTPNIYSVRGWS